MTTDSPQPAKRSAVDYGVLVLKGFSMGTADVVPGVSGGTMAFILGIYEELIESIKSVNLETVKLAVTFKWKTLFQVLPWQFLLALFSGIMLAVFSLAQVLEWLLENRPILLWPIFFGLILASVFVVSKRVQQWTPGTIAAVAAATLFAFGLVGMIPTKTPDTPLFIFGSGAIAISAMLLPGISGSFILVLLGKYQTILGAVNDRDFIILLTFMAGALVGLMTFARLLSWLFKRYHDLTVAALTGFMLGSLRKIWSETTIAVAFPNGGHEIIPAGTNIFSAPYLPQWGTALVLAIIGLSLVIVLEVVASRKSV